MFWTFHRKPQPRYTAKSQLDVERGTHSAWGFSIFHETYHPSTGIDSHWGLYWDDGKGNGDNIGNFETLETAKEAAEDANEKLA